MKSFVPLPSPSDDFQSIRSNGMWYLHWQGGYHDILKLGHPRPKYKTTVLCKLHSPMVPDFLHGGGTEVPFLVTQAIKNAMREAALTGFRFARVEVVKVATRGKKTRRESCGEPEDLVTKAGNKLSDVTPPKLYAVYVTGRVMVRPVHPSGRKPNGHVSPFMVPTSADIPDLWLPFFEKGKLASWTFCSERFKRFTEAGGYSNICFEPAQDWISRMVGRVQR